MTTARNDHMGGYLLAHHTHKPANGVHARYTVTISREAGAGGSSVARRLAAYLDKHQPKDRRAWEVFDHELVAKALEQHRLPKNLEQYMPEDAAHLLPDTVEDLLGLHPAASVLVRHLSETMVNLARYGNVILVGRGGSVSTAHLPNILHVRLVAPYAQRVKHVCRLYEFTPEDAAKFIAKTDRARKRFLRQNFGANIDDHARYDLTINTAGINFDEAAALIGDLVLRRTSAGVARDEHGDAAPMWSLAAAE